MADIDIILKDATGELIKRERLNKIRVHHVLDRYFSVIYEITGDVNGEAKSYILKISTTKRTCENEYDRYVYLKGKGIRSLEPVVHSSKYNYLITKKEKLIEFDVYLKKHGSPGSLQKDFFRLGEFIKNIDEKTGENSNFQKKEYEDYILPRLGKLKILSNSERRMAEQVITKVSSEIDGKGTRKCFVSDFALGNFHLTDDGEFLILDMGDACVGNLYENLASIFLNIKFGPLHQHVENPEKTKSCFKEFLAGCGICQLDEAEFLLFRMRYLINMIRFVDDQQYQNQSASILKRLLSKVSNEYLKNKYKSYLMKICSDSKSSFGI